MLRTVPAPGQTFHVRDQVLASALLAVGVPLKTQMVGGSWHAMTNIYDAKNPARKNNIRVPGVVTFYFEGRTTDGCAATGYLIDAWDRAGNLADGESPQGPREVNRILAALREGNITAAERHKLCDEMEFWHAVAYVQASRVTLRHNANLSGLMVNPRKLPVMAKDQYPGHTRFLDLRPSQV